MKRILPILLLLVLLFGCAKVSEDKLVDTVGEEEAPAIEVEEKVEAPEEKKEPAPEPVVQPEVTDEPVPEDEVITIKKPELELTGELKELMDKLDKKVKNFKYTFGEPPLTTEINTYAVQLENSKGEKELLIRVDLYEYEPTKIQDYWDTVFINPATKEAKIYCLDRTACQTKELDKRNQTEIVEYTKYYKKTPYEWAKEIPKDAQLIGPEVLDKKSVTKFEYTAEDGTRYSVWLDNTYGIPMQVVAKQNGAELKYMFKDMEINREEDAYFIAPF